VTHYFETLNQHRFFETLFCTQFSTSQTNILFQTAEKICYSGSSARSIPSKDKIVYITALEQPEEGKCCFCGRDAVLYYQVGGFEEEWGLARQDCGEVIKRQFEK